MKSLSINMKFWDDGQPNSTRIRNVNFSWGEIKKFTSFLKDNDINAVCNLYDFSVDRVTEDSIHISYPLGVYKKAEKTNIILNDQKNYDFFMMVDCDAFFHKDDYNKFLEIFKFLNDGDVVTFDLAKLEDRVSEYIIDGEFQIEKADWSYAYSGNRNNGPLNGYLGGLGGVYICDTNLLIKLGGFNEKYVGWGGEDGDMLDRIWSSQIPHSFKPVRNFAPFHLPHFSDWGNKLYNQRFENE
jgi:predicted glycosyltransferase involved in capsule biosynthesis